MTEEQSKDVAERTEAFLKEYEELSAKHQVQFGVSPQYIGVGVGIWSTSIKMEPMDMKYLPLKSPLSPQ